MIPPELDHQLGAVADMVTAEIVAAYESRNGQVASDLDVPLWQALAALVEEVGEVARALHDGEPDRRVRAELVQVATVAVLMAARSHYH